MIIAVISRHRAPHNDDHYYSYRVSISRPAGTFTDLNEPLHLYI